jgi:hypothetical protein
MSAPDDDLIDERRTDHPHAVEPGAIIDSPRSASVDADGSGEPAGLALDRWSLRVAFAILGVVTLAHLVIAWHREWTPSSDWASMEMRTRDVGSFGNEPLFGAWSRNDWAHPGPLVFYVLAIPYRLLGADAADLRAATVVVNAITIAFTLWLLRRRGTFALLIGGLALTVLLAGIDAHVMSDYWNATITVLPTALVLVAAWSALDGDRWGAPLAIVGWVWLFQCHFGYGTVTAIPVAVAVVSSLRKVPSARRWIIRSVVVGAITFVPVALDVLAHWPGNLGRAIRWNLTDDQIPVGFNRSGRVVARASSWTFFHEWKLPAFDKSIGVVPPGMLPGLGWIVLLAGAALTMRRSRASVQADRMSRAESSVLKAAAILCLTWVMGFLAIARIRGELLAWIIDWLAPLAALTWAVGALGLIVGLRSNSIESKVSTVGAEVGRELGQRSSERRTPCHRQLAVVSALALGGTLAAAVDHLAEARRSPYVNETWGSIVAQFADDAWEQTGGVPLYLEFEGEPRSAGAVHVGIVNEWERRGGDVAVPSVFALQMGSHRTPSQTAAGESRRSTMLVRLEGRGDMPPPDGARVVSISTPLTDDEQAELDRLTDELAVALTAAGLADRVAILNTNVANLALVDAPPELEARRQDFDRVTELRAKGERFVLYLLPS